MTATKEKLRLVRSTASTLHLETGEVAHVGVDVHKASYHVAVVTTRGTSSPPGPGRPARTCSSNA